MNKQTKELRRQARSLRPAVQVGRGGVTAGVVEQIRRCFVANVLIKVRINSDDRDDVAGIARRLAAEVPCELIERSGFVAVLYSAEPPGDPAASKDA